MFSSRVCVPLAGRSVHCDWKPSPPALIHTNTCALRLISWSKDSFVKQIILQIRDSLFVWWWLSRHYSHCVIFFSRWDVFWPMWLQLMKVCCWPSDISANLTTNFLAGRRKMPAMASWKCLIFNNRKGNRSVLHCSKNTPILLGPGLCWIEFIPCLLSTSQRSKGKSWKG